ncbi:MAG: cell division protein ZapE [Gammaproteobacteria bacterium]|nr:cell division protein ZapE [Gammaproteobacteria bacterium]
MTPMQRYLADVRRGNLLADQAQQTAVEHTQRLYDELIADAAAPPGLLGRVRRWLGAGTRAPVRGLYLWGDVGRGKTRIVNSFYAALPFEEKRRLHFHAFMQQVHARLAVLEGTRDPLDTVAAGFADEARVICFDEFQVSDITDAMLLGRLLGALFARRVTLVATSNIAPWDLYRGGLQREQFLPAIELIETHTRIVQLDGAVDYRLRVLEKAEIYHSPLDARAGESLAESFAALSRDDTVDGEALEVGGRRIATRRLAEGVAWFDFSALCETPRAASDYMEIARRFHTVLISDVPLMDDDEPDRVIRFIQLLDELYEHRVNVIVSAAAPPDELYRGRRLAERFARARSRLAEMQTRDYLARTHLA